MSRGVIVEESKGVLPIPTHRGDGYESRFQTPHQSPNLHLKSFPYSSIVLNTSQRSQAVLGQRCGDNLSTMRTGLLFFPESMR
jgi:hypothetical protein